MKYFVFDVANTLLHKPSLWSKIQEVLLAHNIRVEERDLRLRHKILSETITFPDKTNKTFYLDFNAELLLSLGIIPKKELVEAVFDHCTYLAWEAFEDTQCLASLSKPLGIISNWDTSLPEKLQHYFPSLTFKSIVGSARVGFRKPQKEIFEIALHELGCLPQDIVFVGDSLRMDITPASELGIQAVLIDRENFYPYAQVRRIQHFRELLEWA